MIKHNQAPSAQSPPCSNRMREWLIMLLYKQRIDPASPLTASVTVSTAVMNQPFHPERAVRIGLLS
jgi:hypothetical protein